MFPCINSQMSCQAMFISESFFTSRANMKGLHRLRFHMVCKKLSLIVVQVFTDLKKRYKAVTLRTEPTPSECVVTFEL